MIFTTNKALKAWGAVLHDHDLAEAIVDRVLERGRHLPLDGPSYRTKHLKLDEDQTPGETHQARIPGSNGPEFPEPTRVDCALSEQAVRPSPSSSDDGFVEAAALSADACAHRRALRRLRTAALLKPRTGRRGVRRAWHSPSSSDDGFVEAGRTRTAGSGRSVALRRLGTTASLKLALLRAGHEAAKPLRRLRTYFLSVVFGRRLR
jgi:IstB-like ATP binding protein